MSELEGARTPREVIERIRNEEYLLDIEGESDKVKRGARSLHKKLNSALKLLSEELYSKQTHFVLELIQNADDNDYAAGVVPKLTLALSPERLILVNNEKGFTEGNVQALCSVGESSKAKKSGYIGEKGIGFKSVFLVSNAPEIHSNEYHFRFDRSEETNLLGYVVPHWCEPIGEANKGFTTIILPAKDGYRFGSETLEGIDASLLLFLSRIRKLTLEGTDARVTYRRKDREGISYLTTKRESTEVPSQIKEMRFVRVATVFSMQKVSDEKRPDVETSTVVLAMPVDSTGAADPQPTSQVFAFLPIRQFGFKFSIQADFILSSSREDIQTDRRWNRLLRDGISVSFKVAVEHFKKSDALAFSYLKFIPSDTEVLDPFFKPVVAQTIALLSETQSLLSASGVWSVPKELRYGGKRFRKLFPPAVALELFGFDYVDPRVQAEDDLLKQLGAKPITYVDYINVFKGHGDWLKKQPQDWKAEFYAILAELEPKTLLKLGLASTPCVPTVIGDLAVPEKTSVFYPLSRGRKYGFEPELTIVDSELLDKAATHSSRVNDLFVALKVKTDDPYDLVTSHILPRHQGESWMTSEHKAMIGHLRYIKDKLSQYLTGASLAGKTEAQAIADIRNGIWVGTKGERDGDWLFDRAENLYFSKEYKSAFCIETLLGAEIDDDSLVSPAYLASKAKDAEVEAESWRAFLSQIGVRVAPKLVALPDGNSECSEELRLLLDSQQSTVRKATLECLDRHWSNYVGKLTYSARAGRSALVLETKFAEALHTMKAPTRRRASLPISESYYPSPELKELFGDRPTYVDATLTNAVLLDTCRITHRVDAKACIKRLQQLKVEGGDTIPQLQAIYRHLERFWEKDAAVIKHAFADEGLIRVKGTHAVWARLDEVTWRSNSRFLDSLYPPIYGQYRDFSVFFIDRLGIPRDLPTAKWVHALSRLDEIESPDERWREANVIYRRASRDLGPKFGRDEAPAPGWIEVFQNEEVFLNHRDELVANDESLFANDSPEIAELFSDDAKVSILAVPFEDIPRVSRLLQAAQVQLLSESIEVQVVEVVGGKLRNDLTTRVRQVAPFIERVLYAKSLETFEEAVAKGLFARLRHLEVVEVPELQLEVTLAGVSRRTSADIATSGDRVLVRTGAPSVKNQLATELCKLLGAPDELVDTVALMLMEEDVESIEDFLKVRRIGPLPADVQASLIDGAGKQSTSAEHVGEPDEPQPFADSDEVDMGRIDEESSLPEVGFKAGTADAEVSGLGDVSDGSNLARNGVSGGGSADAHGTQKEPRATVNTQSGRQAPSSLGKPTQESPGLETPSPSAGEAKVKSASQGDTGSPECTSTNTGASDNTSIQGGGTGETAAQEPPGIRYSDRPSGSPETSRFKRPRGRTHQMRTKAGRLMSYAASPSVAHREGDSDDPEKAAARDATGKAAVDYFLATQASRWSALTPMPHNNPGFDIKAVAHDGAEEFIEVKGQSAAWTEDGVALTPKELETAQRWGERFWLCVVEYVQDEKRRGLYLLKNPYGLTQQFRFDSGWKSAALSEAAVPLKPEAGLFIEIPGEGKGQILSVRKKGRFYGLHVVLEGGRQVNKLFNPATMKLSTE